MDNICSILSFVYNHHLEALLLYSILMFSSSQLRGAFISLLGIDISYMYVIPYILICLASWTPVAYVSGIAKQMIFLHGLRWQDVDYSLYDLRKTVTYNNSKFFLLFSITGFGFRYMLLSYILTYIGEGYYTINNVHYMSMLPIRGKLYIEQQDSHSVFYLGVPHSDLTNSAGHLKSFMDLNNWNINHNLEINSNILHTNGFTHEGNIYEYKPGWYKNLPNPAKRATISALGNGITHDTYIEVSRTESIPFSYAKSLLTKHISEIHDYHVRGAEIPNINLHKSYRSITTICNQYKTVLDKPSSEFEVKSLFGGILNHYFKPKCLWLPSSENKTGTGQVDYVLKYDLAQHRLLTDGRSTKAIGETDWSHVCCVELKAKNGDSWTDLLLQAGKYAEYDNTNPGLFVICVKDSRVAYFLFEQDYHSSNGFDYKGAGFDGLLGLYADSQGVKILPQINVFLPQIRIYDLFGNNFVHEYSNHTILRYISTCRKVPDFNQRTLSIVGGNSNILNQLAEVGTTPPMINQLGLRFRIGANGMLVRG